VSFWTELKERGARIVEKRSMSEAERQEWTAAVLMLRSFWVTPDGKTVARKELKADKPWWWSKVRDGIGPVYLAREAFKSGLISQRQLDGWTYDTVLWVRGYNPDGKAIVVKIGNDFGSWKDAVADGLAAYDIEDPRSDNRRRLAAWAVLIAGVAVGTAVVVLTAGAGTPAVVAAVGGWSSVAGGVGSAGLAGANSLWDSSDKSEAAYNQAAEAVAGVKVATEGSDVGRAAGSGAGTFLGSLLSGEDIGTSADRGLQAYGTTRAEQTAPPPAPPAVAGTGEQLASWARTPGGMITIGAVAVVLVVLATRK